MPPLWMLKYLPNMLACHVSILHNAQGPNNTITEANVAGLLALGEAFRIIGRDQADFFLVGGADSKINPLSMSRQCLFEPLSRRNDTPQKACRPFDRQRDGTVLGRRGRRIRPGRAGTRPTAAGPHLRRSRRLRGRLRPRAGRVAAWPGRSAPPWTKPEFSPGDRPRQRPWREQWAQRRDWEAAGLRKSFAIFPPRCRCSPPRATSATWARGSGPAELTASLLALEHGVLPRTLNYEEPDPACPVAVVADPARPIERPYVLKVGFTEMGQCAALVCRKWNE